MNAKKITMRALDFAAVIVIAIVLSVCLAVVLECVGRVG